MKSQRFIRRRQGSLKKKAVSRRFSKPKRVWKPHPYQKKAKTFLINNRAAGLLLDPGLGKTSIVLSALVDLFADNDIQHVLVITPLRPLYDVWPVEIKKWGFDLTYTILHGPDKEANYNKNVQVYLVNPDGLRWLFAHRQMKFDTLVVDESTKFKNYRGVTRFKLIKRYLRKFKRRIILTGTPTPNGLMNLFCQIYILDLGRSLGGFITQYRNSFFTSTGYKGYVYELQDDGEKRIYKAIAPYVLRLDAKDYLKLPPKIETDIEITMDKHTARIYGELENDFINMFSRENVVTASKVSLLNKLRQITGGFVYDDNKKAIPVHTSKIDAMLDLIDELEGQPVMVAYQYRYELEMILKALPKGTPHIGGGVSAKASSDIVRRWNRGEIPVLPVHPASVSHGLNMQEAGRGVIWYTLTYDLEIYEQTNARIWRQGQKNHVFIYHLMMKGSIDENVRNILKEKNKSQSALLNAMKGRYKIN